MRGVVLALVALWIVSVGAAAARRQQKIADPAVDPAVVSALREEGATLFGSDCAACHGAEGGESVGPPMTNNAALANKDQVIKRILDGMPAKGMPPFATSYTDRKIAAVSTFIRGSFENAYGPVVEADVARVRDETKKKWSGIILEVARIVTKPDPRKTQNEPEPPPRTPGVPGEVPGVDTPGDQTKRIDHMPVVPLTDPKDTKGG